MSGDDQFDPAIDATEDQPVDGLPADLDLDPSTFARVFS
jgi:hypothetical protein